MITSEGCSYRLLCPGWSMESSRFGLNLLALRSKSNGRLGVLFSDRQRTSLNMNGMSFYICLESSSIQQTRTAPRSEEAHSLALPAKHEILEMSIALRTWHLESLNVQEYCSHMSQDFFENLSLRNQIPSSPQFYKGTPKRSRHQGNRQNGPKSTHQTPNAADATATQ